MKLRLKTLLLGLALVSSSLRAADYKVQKIVGASFESQEVAGRLCEDSSFTDVNMKAAHFKFSNRVQSCDFERVNADAAYFDSYFTKQTFKDSSFVGAQIRLNSHGLKPSEIKFIGSDLRGAIIMGVTSNVSFIDSKLDGARINDRLCDETLACLEAASTAH